MHACKCGFLGDATRECRCTPGQIQQYLNKISGPLLDRIDIRVEVPAVPFKELRGDALVTSSAEIRGRVEQARRLQQRVLHESNGIRHIPDETNPGCLSPQTVMEVRMNVIGNLGDPQKVASALDPLVANAEDKALAELHASLAVVVSALHQEIAGLRQDLTTVTREGIARFASVADDAVVRMEKTISTLGVGYQVTVTKKLS